MDLESTISLSHGASGDIDSLKQSPSGLRSPRENTTDVFEELMGFLLNWFGGLSQKFQNHALFYCDFRDKFEVSVFTFFWTVPVDGGCHGSFAPKVCKIPKLLTETHD